MNPHRLRPKYRVQCAYAWLVALRYRANKDVRRLLVREMLRYCAVRYDSNLKWDRQKAQALYATERRDLRLHEQVAAHVVHATAMGYYRPFQPISMRTWKVKYPLPKGIQKLPPVGYIVRACDVNVIECLCDDSQSGDE